MFAPGGFGMGFNPGFGGLGGLGGPMMGGPLGGLMIAMQMMQMMQMLQMMMGQQQQQMGGGGCGCGAGMGDMMGMNPGMSGGMPQVPWSPFPPGWNQPGGGLQGFTPPYGGYGGNPGWGSCQPNPGQQITSCGPNPSKQQIGGMLDQASQKYGIPPNILKAVAFKESGWNPNARGDGGASFGMMQIFTRAHPDYDAARGARDPAYNIDYAARFLSGLGRRHGGNWSEAVRAYNGSGPAARAYSANVMQLAQQAPWQRWGVR